MAPAGTRMAPTIAIAAGDRFSLTQFHFGRRGVLQQQPCLYRFVVQKQSRFHVFAPSFVALEL